MYLVLFTSLERTVSPLVTDMAGLAAVILSDSLCRSTPLRGEMGWKGENRGPPHRKPHLVITTRTKMGTTDEPYEQRRDRPTTCFTATPANPITITTTSPRGVRERYCRDDEYFRPKVEFAWMEDRAEVLQWRPYRKLV